MTKTSPVLQTIHSFCVRSTYAGSLLLTAFLIFLYSSTLFATEEDSLLLREVLLDTEFISELSTFTISTDTERLNGVKIPEHFIYYYGRGYDNYANSDYDEAIINFSIAHELYSDNYATQLALGKAYSENSDLQTGLELFDNLTVREPDKYQAWFWRGIVLSDSGLYNAANLCYKSALLKKGGRNDMRVWVKRIINYSRLREYKKALACVDSGKAVNDRSSFLWHAYGYVCMDMDNDSLAIIAYDNSINYGNQDDAQEMWYKYHNRGLARQNIEDYSGSLEDFKIVLEYYPQYGSAWSDAGDSYRYSYNYEQALACYDSSFKYSNPIIKNDWWSRAFCYYNLANYKKSLECFHKYLEYYPKEPEAIEYVGWCLTNSGKNEKALVYFDSCLAIDTAYHDGIFGRAYAEGELNRFNTAVATYDKYLEIYPASSVSWYNRGNELWNANLKMSALRSYDSCLKYDNTYVDAWENKSALLLELGQLSDAGKCHDSAVSHGLSSEKETSGLEQYLRSLLDL